MNKPRPCGCKGRRSCLVCEEQYNIQPQLTQDFCDNVYEYCHHCGLAWKLTDENSVTEHPHHKGSKIDFPGVYIEHNFLDEIEKNKLLEGINNEPWSLSQSGRRKQNYGPKCNFKKRIIKNCDFLGFPKYSKFVHDKFKNVSILKDFQVIEQCVLEYDPKRGASIDPHIDDCWIWGERIVTVNVLGDTFLTMTQYTGDKKKYNRDYLDTYVTDLPKITPDIGHSNSSDCVDGVKVRIFMPERSLIVLYGPARYNWEHAIPRNDIKSYRLCLAYREFTPPYLTGKFKYVGDEILEVAKEFF